MDGEGWAISDGLGFAVGGYEVFLLSLVCLALLMISFATCTCTHTTVHSGLLHLRAISVLRLTQDQLRLAVR